MSERNQPLSPAAMPARFRDHRIDFWRGLALVMIFIDHVPGNVFEKLTLRNFGVSDSAEIFVFLSGFSAAIAYFTKFMGGAPVYASVRVYQRVGKLYMAHVVTLVGAIALYFGAAIWLSDAHWTKVNGLDFFIRDPVHAMVGLATLAYQIGYFNILPLYVVLLAGLPVLMVLARRNLSMAFSASFALYAIAHLGGWALPNVPEDGAWFFDPFSWQLLFTIGFIAGALYSGREPVPFNGAVYGLAVLVLVAGAVIQFGQLWPLEGSLPVPNFLYTFDKATLALPRMVHALALIYVVAHLPYGWIDARIMRSGLANPLSRMGRHSLPVFCFGALLSVVGQVLERRTGGTFAADAVIIISGLGLQLGLAMWLDLWKAITAPRPAAGRAPAEAALARSAGR
ncbi:OpgC domain-containing protein [Pseudoxanthobacter sp.]|uniref:OpgC family protein n=1 Tax=Pseudoxanthobacter sp. TaxID=1925742 RepID=UPI002FE06B0C